MAPAILRACISVVPKTRSNFDHGRDIPSSRYIRGGQGPYEYCAQYVLTAARPDGENANVPRTWYYRDEAGLHPLAIRRTQRATWVNEHA